MVKKASSAGRGTGRSATANRPLAPLKSRRHSACTKLPATMPQTEAMPQVSRLLLSLKNSSQSSVCATGVTKLKASMRPL